MKAMKRTKHPKILKHLAENDEQGTLEGIVAWWLLQEEMKKAALLKATELIQENLLLERQAAIARDASK